MTRNTRQREAIRQAFATTSRPLSPHEVLAAAQARVPRLGIATVYRALRDLVAEHWLQPVELPGHATRYERAGKHHHHHFSCRACGRVFDVAGCPGNLQQLLPTGFELAEHDVLLHGRCADCVAAGV